MTPLLHLMTGEDAAAVVAIQSEYYAGDLVEPEAVIRDRLRVFPDTAWVAEDAAGVCAYLSACRTQNGRVMRLGHAFPATEMPDSLYLHDLAVSRRAAGKGIGRQLALLALETARTSGLRHMALVSLPGALPFWRKLGFRDSQPLTGHDLANLLHYGPQARYLSLNLE